VSAFTTTTTRFYRAKGSRSESESFSVHVLGHDIPGLIQEVCRKQEGIRSGEMEITQEDDGIHQWSRVEQFPGHLQK
jgi:hypothetical protein